MPAPIPTALDDHGAAAVTKAGAARDIPRYLLSGAMAGAYVGVAIVLLLSVSAPLAAAGSPAAKLVQAAVFGLALTLVVFAGAELFTGNVMVMTQGWWRGRIRPRDALVVCALSLLANIAGSILLAAAVHAGGTAGGVVSELVATIVQSKDAATGTQLFWRAVLCNALVCLALWMAARATSDGAKLAVLWWALLAFIGSGFEHSIANVTTFALGAFDGSIGWGALARNLAWTVPGNIVGGGLVVGLGYAWIGGRRTVAQPAPTAVAAPAEGTPALVPSAGD